MTTPRTGIDRYHEVLHFYARHMQLLDRGAADAWAGTFTEDGSFRSPSMTAPVRGRAGIAAGARAAVAAATGEQRRHWVAMLTVTPAPQHRLQVRYHTQIIVTAAAATPRVELSCMVDDVLVDRSGTLLVERRVITRDDQPAG